jgi:hypothetical protein
VPPKNNCGASPTCFWGCAGPQCEPEASKLTGPRCGSHVLFARCSLTQWRGYNSIAAISNRKIGRCCGTVALVATASRWAYGAPGVCIGGVGPNGALATSPTFLRMPHTPGPPAHPWHSPRPTADMHAAAMFHVFCDFVMLGFPLTFREFS